MAPSPKTVVCSLQKEVTVPTFDFETQFLSLVTNAECMQDSNFIQTNFDKNILRPTKSYEEFGPDDLIDDIHTGELYHKGIELYCNDRPPAGVDLIIPAPLICFADEANKDRSGACSTEPLSYTIGFFNQRARMRYDMWRHFGYAPNTSVGHGNILVNMMIYG